MGRAELILFPEEDGPAGALHGEFEWTNIPIKDHEGRNTGMDPSSRWGID